LEIIDNKAFQSAPPPGLDGSLDAPITAMLLGFINCSVIISALAFYQLSHKNMKIVIEKQDFCLKINRNN
jgi:hypothetical protein